MPLKKKEISKIADDGRPDFLHQLKARGWIIKSELLSEIEKWNSDFKDDFLIHIEKNPDITHFLYYREPSEEPAILACCQKVLDLLDCPPSILGRGIWSLISLIARYTPTADDWRRFTDEQNRRREAISQGIWETPPFPIPLDTTMKPLNREYRGFYFMKVNARTVSLRFSPIQRVEKNKPFIRAASFFEIEELNEEAFEERLEQWRKENYLLDKVKPEEFKKGLDNGGGSSVTIEPMSEKKGVRKVRDASIVGSSGQQLAESETLRAIKRAATLLEQKIDELQEADTVFGFHEVKKVINSLGDKLIKKLCATYDLPEGTNVDFNEVSKTRKTRKEGEKTYTTLQLRLRLDGQVADRFSIPKDNPHIKSKLQKR